MNDMIEITSLYHDMVAAYEELDAGVKCVDEVVDAVQQVQHLLNEVTQYGWSEHTKAAISSSEGFAAITVLPVDKVVALESSEALSETIKEGIKKFFKKVAEIVAKIIEFFSKLFNTTNQKCKDLLEKWDKINMEKKVVTFKKEQLTHITAAVAMLDKYVKDNIQIGDGYILTPPQLAQRLAALAGASKGILTATGSTSKIRIADGVMNMSEDTLADAGWALADGSKIARMYLDRSKNYTSTGSAILKVANGFLASQTMPNFFNGCTYHDVFAAYGADTSAYTCCAKLQGCVVKQIVAFWKCLEETSVKVNPDQPKQLEAA